MEMATEKEFRILIVEDEDLIVEMLEEYFSLVEPKLKLSFAKNLQEARQLLQKDSFDLCIVDCNLPDGTACDLFHEKAFSCPVIVTTGYVDEKKFASVKQFTKKPVFLFQKPYLPADLLEKIKELLGHN
ncbi:MAG: response regulator [Thermodesulfobacteria bacterium]|nr:response regulator [Thermodesulfobacteriota bacterium]